MTQPVEKLLDETHSSLKEGRCVARAMDTLVRGLHAYRDEVDDHDWKSTLERCRTHALRSLLLQDPFTKRSVTKPRGYAGDAIMLDHIYRGLDPVDDRDTSPLGRAIFEYTAGNSLSAVAVRNRRALLASTIDEVAARVRSPRILSVACGHLREASLSKRVMSGDVAQYIALDQDAESLSVVARELEGTSVVALRASVRDIVSGRVPLDGFDLIYAAGLYDYLDQTVAIQLTSRLFTALRPGGRLLLGNFARGFETAEYMAAFMDWVLQCRTDEEMEAVASAIPPAERTTRVFRCETGCITYVDVRRTEKLTVVS